MAQNSYVVAAATDSSLAGAEPDALLAKVNDDGSWVIAVADGWKREASRYKRAGTAASVAAVSEVPGRIEDEGALLGAFDRAHDSVRQLAESARSAGRHVSEGLTTLLVAAWTPKGGGWVGQAGDSAACFVGRIGSSPEVRLAVPLHRDRKGQVSVFLGAGEPDPAGNGKWSDGRVATASFSDEDAVIIATEGAWGAWGPSPHDFAEAVANELPIGGDLVLWVEELLKSAAETAYQHASIAAACKSIDDVG